jgi:hypothetical protein
MGVQVQLMMTLNFNYPHCLVCNTRMLQGIYLFIFDYLTLKFSFICCRDWKVLVDEWYSAANVIRGRNLLASILSLAECF